MGSSSVLGVAQAPLEAKRRNEQALGPADSSDSASDLVGADDLPSADPGEPIDVTLGRDVPRRPIEQTEVDGAQLRADITVDRVFNLEEEVEGENEAAAAAERMARHGKNRR